jgi:CRP-like cAMP-binding protein
MSAIKKSSTATNQCGSLNFFKNLTLFKNLSEKEVACFVDAAQIKSYKKGQYLYMEGDKAKYFYIICNGWIKLLRATEDGEETIIAMLTKNNITGESAFFEEGDFANTAQIAEDAQILSIPIALLKEQMGISNQLALNMLTSMIQYQRRHEMQLEQFLMYSAPQRVGCFLLGLCPVLEQKDGVVIVLPYDKSLIANLLGMKGPTFSRALNMLRDQTGTHIRGSRVTVRSMKKLLNFVGGCYLPQYMRKA